MHYKKKMESDILKLLSEYNIHMCTFKAVKELETQHYLPHEDIAFMLVC